MLNRTNQSLSASIIGLNLGTRSLANLAGRNIGGRTPMLRPTHPQGRIAFMRDGEAMKSKRKQPTIFGSYPPSISSPPCSPSVSRWHELSGTHRARFAVGVVPSFAEQVVESEYDRAARFDARAQSQRGCRWVQQQTPTQALQALVAITAAGG